MDGKEPSSWSRRAVLSTTGAVSALAVAGCVSEEDPEETGDDDGGGDESDSDENGQSQSDESVQETGPEALAEGFFEAFERGDVEKLNELIHDDSPMDPVEEDGIADPSDLTFEKIDAETVEESEEEAVVELLLTFDPPDEEPVTEASYIEARTADGQWYVWEISPSYDGEGARVPSVDFDLDRTDSGVEISHQGGDQIRADRLVVQGEGIEATGDWVSLGGQTSGDIDGNPAIHAGDSLRLETEDSYTIRLLWENEQQGITVTLRSTSASRGSAEDEVAVEPPEDQGVDAYLAETENFDGEIVDWTGRDEVTVAAGETADSSGHLGFSPPAIRIDPGTTVTWEVEAAAHSVTSVDGSFESEILGEGESWAYTFDDAGEYLYFCRPHRAIGMRGAVIVEESG